MKTIFLTSRKNNVQKTVLRTVAVILSFVLISFTVSAQDFWKRLIINSSFNEIAVAMTENKKETKQPERTKSPTGTNSAENKTENAMNGYIHFYSFDYKAETEKPLQLEKWMLNSTNFDLELEHEKALSLENWMVSENHWQN